MWVVVGGGRKREGAGTWVLREVLKFWFSSLSWEEVATWGGVSDVLAGGLEPGAGRKSREGQGTKKSRGLGDAPFMCRRAWDTISKKIFLPSGPAGRSREGGGRRRTAIWAGPRLGQPVQRDHPQKTETAHRTVPAQIPPPSPIGGPRRR